MASNIPLEKDATLSSSMIWNLQQQAYQQFGIDAWSKKGVPFYITSNPYTVHQYVKIAFAYVQDLLKNQVLDFNHPLYFFDLGAGSGRFSYLFLKELLKYLDDFNLKQVKICLVMTDIAQKNISFWQHNPYLKPFVEAEILDFALYQHASNDPIALIRSQKQLSNFVNPAIVIANYFFDTIPQDAFRINSGVIEEGKISISAPSSISLEQAEILSKMEYHFTYSAIDHSNYYSQFPLVNTLLSHYQEKFSTAHFQIPIGAIQSIHYFQKLCRKGFLLLAGDQGLSSEEQLIPSGPPVISKHGSFSIPVNYHALKMYINLLNGFCYLPKNSDFRFVVMAARLGAIDFSYTEMESACEDTLGYFAPGDYLRIVDLISEECPNQSVEHLLLLLKFSRWDPMLMHHFFPLIHEKIKKLPSEMSLKLREAIQKIAQNIYPLSEDEGLFVMNLGVLLFEMQFYEDALEYFKRAEQISGTHPQIMQNKASCLKMLRKPFSR